MGEVHFVDVMLALSRPTGLISKGGLKREVLRRFEVSLPIRDVVRAEQLMDHLAKGLVVVFAEVEQRDASQREAAQEVSGDGGRGVSSRGDGENFDPPPTPSPGPDGDSRDPLGSDLPPSLDAESGSDKEKEGKVS